MLHYPWAESWNHFVRKRATTMLLAAVMVAAMPNHVLAYEDGWHAWRAYEAIQGVGAIVKDSPDSTSWLHWNNNGTGESASFSVTYSSPTDRDRRVCYYNDKIVDEEIHDFGVADHEEWHASAGSISNTGVYTPPSHTSNAVTIECFVKDGPGGYEHEQVHREWGGHLKIFKVGVEVQPAGITIWEDDATAEHVWTRYSNGDNLAAYKKTGVFASGGDYINSASGWNLSCSWTTRTYPGGGGQGIQGTINFTPNIKATGLLQLEGKGEGWNNPVCSIVTNAVAAAGVAGSGSNPYIAAAATVLVTLGGGGSNINVGFAGDAAIQYIDDSAGTLKVENVDWGLWDYNDWMYLNGVNLASVFNVSGVASLKGDETRSGSAKGAVTVGIRDDSMIMWHAGRSYTVLDTSLKYGTSRPTYSGP